MPRMARVTMVTGGGSDRNGAGTCGEEGSARGGGGEGARTSAQKERVLAESERATETTHMHVTCSM
eukprot:794781-Rhodomonas_salina.1